MHWSKRLILPLEVKSTITSKKFTRITRGNPHFLFKFRHSSKQDSHIIFINFRKLLHRQWIFSQPRLDGISRTVIKIDKPVFVSGIPGRRRLMTIRSSPWRM